MGSLVFYKQILIFFGTAGTDTNLRSAQNFKHSYSTAVGTGRGDNTRFSTFTDDWDSSFEEESSFHMQKNVIVVCTNSVLI